MKKKKKKKIKACSKTHGKLTNKKEQVVIFTKVLNIVSKYISLVK